MERLSAPVWGLSYFFEMQRLCTDGRDLPSCSDEALRLYEADPASDPVAIAQRVFAAATGRPAAGERGPSGLRVERLADEIAAGLGHRLLLSESRRDANAAARRLGRVGAERRGHAPTR